MTEEPRDQREKKLRAVALKYERGKQKAPVVMAKGANLMAEKIIAEAKKHGIPLHEDSELIQVLMKLDLNQEIPPEVYQVVADILAMVYRASKQFK